MTAWISARCPTDLSPATSKPEPPLARVALTAPLKQIANNAGLEGSALAAKVADLPAGHGLNASTGAYVDMFATGIIEPAKVTLAAPQNATSVAPLFLTTEVVIADKPAC